MQTFVIRSVKKMLSFTAIQKVAFQAMDNSISLPPEEPGANRDQNPGKRPSNRIPIIALRRDRSKTTREVQR